MDMSENQYLQPGMSVRPTSDEAKEPTLEESSVLAVAALNQVDLHMTANETRVGLSEVGAPVQNELLRCVRAALCKVFDKTPSQFRTSLSFKKDGPVARRGIVAVELRYVGKDRKEMSPKMTEFCQHLGDQLPEIVQSLAEQASSIQPPASGRPVTTGVVQDGPVEDSNVATNQQGLNSTEIDGAHVQSAGEQRHLRKEKAAYKLFAEQLSRRLGGKGTIPVVFSTDASSYTFTTPIPMMQTGIADRRVEVLYGFIARLNRDIPSFRFVATSNVRYDVRFTYNEANFATWGALIGLPLKAVVRVEIRVELDGKGRQICELIEVSSGDLVVKGPEEKSSSPDQLSRQQVA